MITFYHFIIIYFSSRSGLRRAIVCMYNALRTRHFVQKHKLILEQKANQNDIAFFVSKKGGIPDGCGFDFPVVLFLFIISLLSLMYWMLS